MSGARATPVGRGRVAAAAATAATLLAGAVTGCGASANDGSPADRREIRAAIVELQQAFATRDYAYICSTLTEAARRHVGQAGHKPVEPCEENLRWLAPAVRSTGVPPRRIAAIEVDGDAATATVTFGPNAIGRVPLAREDGRWKVDALYGDLPAGEQKDRF